MGQRWTARLDLPWAKRSGRLAPFVAGFGSLFLASAAEAGNADAFYLSGEATLSGGAVTAMTTGGSSIWYNPAGLSSLQGTRLDVSVSGYAVRFGATADFDSAIPNTQETRLTPFEFDVVPAALALTRRFGDVGVGIGVFVPNQSSIVIRTHLLALPDADGNSLEFSYDSTSQSEEYHAGPGVGWDVTEALSLGASLLANYRTRVEVTDVSTTVESTSEKTSWMRHQTLDSQGVGLELVFGAQYRFLQHWSLGGVVRTPAIRLGEAVQSVETQLIADTHGTVEDDVVFDQSFGVSTEVLTPFRFHLGGAYELKNITASVDGSLLLPFENELFDLEERTTWNARAGIKSRLNEVWTIGGGIYTDRSPYQAPVEFQQSQIDYYGATLALDWVQGYGVYSKGQAVLEEPRALVFGTTVALSYAIGIGKIAGARVAPSPVGGIVLEQNVVDVFAHEISLHIASSLGE